MNPEIVGCKCKGVFIKCSNCCDNESLDCRDFIDEMDCDVVYKEDMKEGDD